MTLGSRSAREVPGDAYPRALEHAPSPFAVTRGPAHSTIYVNRAFREQVLASETILGAPFIQLLSAPAASRFGATLDRVFERRVSVHEQLIGPLAGRSDSWSCCAWPLLGSDGRAEGVMVEFRSATHAERTAALQREVAERLLLSALRDSEAAQSALAAQDRSTFLLDAGHRLRGSLDESETRTTIADLPLPTLGAWCIVDVIEAGGEITRLSLIHRDPEKQALLSELAKDWAPRPQDAFGAPAVARNAQPLTSIVKVSEVAEALASGAHTEENLRLLGELGVGPLLTVPLVSRGTLLGAVTFVSGQPGREYTREDVDLAEELAARSAEALSNARLYGDALLLREQADLSNRSKTRFLGNISHELRTPLNAIGGYAQLIEEGVHGPVTESQRRSLERIRLNKEHLLVLITDILNFVRAGLPPALAMVPVPVHSAVDRVLAMLEGSATRKAIHFLNEASDDDVAVKADPQRLQQILINLISNAIKFTPWEGLITIRCEVADRRVRIDVIDTGMGIESEKLDAIFEPFVQVDPQGEVAGGVGLGLPISRDLARAMGGELTVDSTPRKGSTFTLMLDRADLLP